MKNISASSGGSLSYSNFSNIVYDFNTLIGLSAFSFNSASYFNFDLVVSAPNSLSITTPNSTNCFGYLEFQNLIVLTYYCGYQIPYYFASNNNCYDVCPVRYYGNDISLTC